MMTTHSKREGTYKSNPDIVYYDISVKEDLIVAVGTTGSQAVMMMGRRK